MTNRWLLLGLAFLARICLPVQFQCLAPVLPFVVADLGLTYAQAGLLIGVFWLPGVVLALAGGMIGTWLGDKKTIVLSLGCMAAGGILLANSASLPVALVGRLLSGIGAVVLTIQLTKIVTDRFAGREIATALGILLTSWPLGIAVTMATLGFVAARSSWHLAVYATVGLAAAALVSMALFYRDDVKPSPAQPKLWSITGRELRMVSAAGLVWMLFNVSFTVVTSFTPLVLISRGHAVGEAGALVSMLSWASLVAVPIGGYAADRIRSPNWIIAGGTIVSGAAILLLVPPGPAVLWLVLFGLAGSLAPGAIMALPAEVLQPQARSIGLGVFYMIYYAGMMLFPLVAGWVQDSTGTAVAAVILGGLLRVLTAGALAGFRFMQRRRPGLSTAAPSK